MWTRAERAALEREAAAVIERLVAHGRDLPREALVADERANILHYLTEVFPDVLPWVDQRLAAAWERAGFDPALRADRKARPRLGFGDWVGGDRDGHPFVDAETTAETLALFRARGAAAAARVAVLARGQASACPSAARPGPAALEAWIAARAAALGPPGAAAMARNPRRAVPPGRQPDAAPPCPIRRPGAPEAR
jgi:phosphoenolpyruvate carboxylase